MFLIPLKKKLRATECKRFGQLFNKEKKEEQLPAPEEKKDENFEEVK
jgi:hypothetical protein